MKTPNPPPTTARHGLSAAGIVVLVIVLTGLFYAGMAHAQSMVDLSAMNTANLDAAARTGSDLSLLPVGCGSGSASQREIGA